MKRLRKVRGITSFIRARYETSQCPIFSYPIFTWIFPHFSILAVFKNFWWQTRKKVLVKSKNLKNLGSWIFKIQKWLGHMFFSNFWVSFRCYITKNDKNIKVNAAEGWICIWFSSLAFKVCQSKKSMKVFQLKIMWYFETQVSDYFRLLWWLNAQKSTLHESTVKPQWFRQKSLLMGSQILLKSLNYIGMNEIPYILRSKSYDNRDMLRG